ncbi:FAD binding domain-containing protein [Variovorax ginsengisoli]|uniref:FAD binding domain-containing protein n=1 Tax=Variovorax ginsengisoli TaxID=363844 RepID=A0ABT8S3X0_9BURK|nr:FAD binding domain-containing protein [Variovorax ginsengisoli]MDN8614451.1 FAD binding domain-containing protein [Variovorax ginsengisoli]MDO1533621.1 FAD binding domain-containing protein [Variovorax ginsengisoli]
MNAPQTVKAARKALVIGGSLGGLFAANLLLRAGWDVHVHERVADELEGRGAGVVTHPELMEVLSAAGVDVTDGIGVEVRERITLARDGQVEDSRPLPQLLTAWGRLYQVLRRAFPSERYHNGRQLVSFEQDAAGVHATFADGEVVHADLLVAADGLRSTVRQMLQPDTRPRYAGYLAWRGLVEEASLSPRVLAELFPYFAFGLPPREQMIAYPVAGQGNSVEPGKRRYNFVWYRPADENTTLREMLTDATGKTWPDGIPPPLIRPEVLAAARQAAQEVLAPQFAEVVQKTPNLFFQPIFDLESSALAFGRVALLGDAAFVARPHCGMGVTKAGSDAAALVRALAETPDVPSALQAYEASRLGAGSFIVNHARALGAYMQAQISTPAEREMAERYRSTEAVMRETAVPPVAH